MRAGNDAQLVFDPKGRLFAIATGSDATTEHEWGAQELLEALTGQAQPTAEDVAAMIRDGRLKECPRLADRRKITQDLERIQYEEGQENGEPVAAVGYSVYHDDLKLLTHRELGLHSLRRRDAYGAWDARGFGFKVRGAKHVQALREFAAKLKQGKAMFAASLLPDAKVSGVIIAIEEMMRPEHRAALSKAQAKFELDVQLHLASRTEELRRLARALPLSKGLNHIWPVWKDNEPGGEVRYALNPGYGVQAQYYGPYTFEELEAWLKSGATTKLVPQAEVQPA